MTTTFTFWRYQYFPLSLFTMTKNFTFWQWPLLSRFDDANISHFHFHNDNNFHWQWQWLSLFDNEITLLTSSNTFTFTEEVARPSANKKKFASKMRSIVSAVKTAQRLEVNLQVGLDTDDDDTGVLFRASIPFPTEKSKGTVFRE